MKIIASGTTDAFAWADIAIVGSALTVDAALADALCALYPTLPEHACKSGSSNSESAESEDRAGARANDNRQKQPITKTFGDYLVGALLPHAAEHIAIELLVAAFPGEVFAGNTTWLSRENHTMKVRVTLPSAHLEESSSHLQPASTGDAIAEAVNVLNRLISLF